jgi:hypothetical protein
VKRSIKTTVAAGAILTAVLATTASSCDPSTDTSGQAKESTSRQSNYDKLITNQPAHTVKYSSTRATKNAWIDTWGQQAGKLAYVYIQNANGEYGYYIFIGPPVSYCTSLVVPYTKTNMDTNQSGQTQAIVPAPGMDGTYGSGNNCNIMYGVDAATKAIVEFSVGNNQSYQAFSEPLTLPQYRNAKQMGPTSVDAAKSLDKKN